jgi:hypothetical protein
VSPEIAAATPDPFVRRMRLSCATCKRPFAVLLFFSGLILMASAGFLLAYVATESWHLGWAARIIGVVLFFTVPGVVAVVVANFRSTLVEASLTKRIAWAGMSLLGLGALEVVLAIAAWISFIALSSGQY